MLTAFTVIAIATGIVVPLARALRPAPRPETSPTRPSVVRSGEDGPERRGERVSFPWY
ncbi:MAG TPA: hypothetical protein RMH85_22170 [Polyangiaceae bacterium LLY-WYZ-15_(1-7)]|nr:hypothetical protein [Polyangiaceae bacterium LLY-WYZ-15_(1-7)]HJL11199.1 hypothetical protein [Polyangiaceae bacterium LLY-WYZ-15_(1-7)]HJL27413.1 hypothetical protein [Polyangiaceae bacterium LLY-WYZ-15_(1-7)]HJL31444.1 hypothetical protein [Polyangiaceae bacterium LLY-WYZ-15_(1-7)]HJL39578.1 hypothetical protein [Polyangiaceae bacterium LLY-WYZ-15_(1-7)]